MQPPSGKISILECRLSETQPIIGFINPHPERRGVEWDMHYDLELGLVCSGRERRLFFDKSERDVGASDVWFCGMWEPHGARIISAPCEVIILRIWPPFLSQLNFPEAPAFCPIAPFNAPPRLRPRTNSKTRYAMMKSGDKLKEIFSSKTPFQSLRLRLVLEDILLCIGESWSGAADWGRRAPFAEFSQINQALKMIFDSHSFVSTEAAAKACGMNRHKFSSLFRSWMKMRFSDFSLRHRLYQAAAQLRSTQDPLKLIAARYGFADESHFYRTFTRHYGVSPHDYRGRKL